MRNGNVVPKAVVLLAVAFAAFAPLPSEAHSEIPGFRNVLDDVNPSIPGVRIEVVTSAAAQLVAENPTPTPLEIVAVGGEGFLRIGASGVEANFASPDWYRSATPEGDGRVPSTAVAGAAPNWVRISSESTWGWFDHRLHATRADRAPAGAGGAGGEGGTIQLGSWTVPARYGADNITITGHREFLRPPGRFRSALTRQVEGIRAGVVDGTVPALSVTAPPGRSLVVLGEEGEPMVRVGPDGPEGNLASPTWLLTAASRGATPDGPVGADVEPRWESLGGGSTLTWLEPRARYPESLPPKAVLDSGESEVVVRWNVPVDLDGERASFIGTTSWVPQSGDGRTPVRNGAPIAIVAGVASAVLTGLLLLGRRRRSLRS